jgi:hypothetical protein
MKIIALPDLHDRGIWFLEFIAEPLRSADVVLLPGDLTDGDRDAGIGQVIEAVRQYNETILAVPGNWDTQHTLDYIQSKGMSVHGCHTIIDSVAFFGAGGALPFIGGFVFKEPMFTRLLNDALDGLDVGIPKIMVCHQPPHNTRNDRTGLRLHAGSRAIRTFIEERQPLICFTGHIHEGIGIDAVGATKIVNPGPIWHKGGGYAYAEVVDGEVAALEIRQLRSHLKSGE